MLRHTLAKPVLFVTAVLCETKTNRNKKEGCARVCFGIAFFDLKKHLVSAGIECVGILHSVVEILYF